MSLATIASAWFYKCKDLEIGEAVLLRVADKKEQTALANAFEEERSALAEADPVLASQLFISKTLIRRKQYVVVERKYRTPFTAFLRTTEGELEKY